MHFCRRCGRFCTPLPHQLQPCLRGRSHLVAVGGLRAFAGTSCAHLPILQLFCRNPITGNLRNQIAEIIQSDPPIFTHDCSTFATVSSKTDGHALICSSGISSRSVADSLHHLQTFLLDSPCISVNSRGIFSGTTPFVFKNRVTARNKHLAVACIGIATMKGCRAKTERGSEVLAGLFGNEEATNTSALPTTAATVSLRPQRLGDLTFGITH